MMTRNRAPETEERDTGAPLFRWTKTLAVASGKGGVGKSTLVANLAMGLVAAGFKVLVFDGDLGMANLDLLFGVTPGRNLYHVLKDGFPLAEVVHRVPGGPDLIAGGNGFTELSTLEGPGFLEILRDLADLQARYQFLLIDTGAGIGRHVLSFCECADETVVVSTPEHASLANAYGLIKVLSQKNQGAVIKILANRVTDAEEGDVVFKKLAAVAWKFLRKKLHFFGALPEDTHVFEAVKAQGAFFRLFPTAPVSQALFQLVENFQIDQGIDDGGAPRGRAREEHLESFFEKLARRIRPGGE